MTDSPPSKPSSPLSGVPQTATEYYLLEYLTHLYGGGVAPEMTKTLLQIVDKSAVDQQHSIKPLSAADMLLITYGDTIIDGQRAPLEVLKEFADATLTPYFSTIHVLPFFPFSSDDGFAVVDYGAVRQDLGDWHDIQALAERFELMFDLVINHCSREHIWFADFVNGRAPGCHFFIERPSDTDLREVVRPRNTPLLSRVETYGGPKHVWTTFSDDQIDLNFENPDVLCRFVEILFDYVSKGATYIRLDAIAFLWKRVGTSCMSLPETHMVVKIMRLLLDYSGASTRLLSETNVPHAENVSYFGQQDEAHMVYQFSLAPLLLYSYLFNDGRYLQEWALALTPPPEHCAYLNFIASHDGIGLRPLEGLVPAEDIERLIETVHARGGFVTMRTGTDGEQTAYEMNISLFAAFGGEANSVSAYVAAHQLLLAFQGVPAFYLRALVGSLNDMQAVERTGRTRSINRGKLRLDQLNKDLNDPGSLHAAVFAGLTRSLKLRAEQPAFSPDASQEILPCPPVLFAMRRTAATQSILILASFLPVEQHVSLHSLIDIEALDTNQLTDLLTGTNHHSDAEIFLGPYQVVWLALDSR